MTAPPPALLSGWLLLAALVGAAVYLFLRASHHGHRLGVQLMIVLGCVMTFALPAIAVMLAQDLTCRDGGVLQRPSGGLIVVGVTGLVLLCVFAFSWLAGARPTGAAWRVTVVAMVLLVPVALVEVMIASVSLEDYCEGLHSLLFLEAALVLVVPIVALGVGAWDRGERPTGRGSFGLPTTLLLASLGNHLV